MGQQEGFELRYLPINFKFELEEVVQMPELIRKGVEGYIKVELFNYIPRKHPI